MPSVSYPNLPELSVRDKLNMEKETAGMYFSGNLLDEYSKHLGFLEPIEIATLLDEENRPEERAAVRIAGIVTSVTKKNTKNGDTMAFFTLEDKMGEIECILFAGQYRRMADLLVADAGLTVSGSISLRDEEAPKVIVATMERLIENRHFREENLKKESEKEKVPEKAVPNKVSRLFLRLPDEGGKLSEKVKNLAGIFEGTFPVYYYYNDEKRYEMKAVGVALDDYLLGEYRKLLGDENVILK